MNYSEITHDAFYAIIPSGAVPVHIEELEHALKEFYDARGCSLLVIHNYLSNVYQFFIADINS